MPATALNLKYVAPRQKALPPEGWRTFLPRRQTAEVQIGKLLDAWHAHLELTKSRSLRDKEGAIRLKLRPAFGAMTAAELAELGVGAVEAYSAWLTSHGYKGKTVRKEVSFLSSFCDFAIRTQALAANPVRNLPRGTLPPNVPADPQRAANEILSLVELRHVLLCEEIPWARRMLYTLTAFTATRFGESAALTWADYGPERTPLGELIVCKSWDCRDAVLVETTKTNLVRHVPVHPFLAEVLARELERRERAGVDDGGLIAPCPQPGGQVSYWSESTALRNWHADLLRAGIPAPTAGPRRLHSLRGTYASLLRRAGADREAVRQITHIGDAPNDAFALYEHLDWPTLCAAVAKLDFEPSYGRARSTRRARRGGRGQ